jgi:hypothetical protein
VTFGRRRIDAVPPQGTTPERTADPKIGGAFAVPVHEVSGLSVVGGADIVRAVPTKESLKPVVAARIPIEEVRTLTRGQLAGRILEIVREWSPSETVNADPLIERNLVTALIEERLAAAKPPEPSPLLRPAAKPPTRVRPNPIASKPRRRSSSPS